MRVKHLLLCLLFVPTQVLAQIPAPQDDTRPVIHAQRVNQAPSIDGRLDDAAWGEAQSVSPFYQKEPLEGEVVTDPTRVRILYDETNLYIGVELLDSDQLKFAPANCGGTTLLRVTIASPSFWILSTITRMPSSSASIHRGRDLTASFKMKGAASTATGTSSGQPRPS